MLTEWVFSLTVFYLHLIISNLHFVNTTQGFTIFKPRNALYYQYCLISPTYVSVPVEPTSGGQGYIHITSIS
jgi:hypothetical protein